MDSTTGTDTGSFVFSGTATLFASTMLALFGGDEDLAVSEQENGIFVRPSGGSLYYEFCRFQAFDIPGGVAKVRWNSPQKAGMSNVIGRLIQALEGAGYVRSPTPAASAAASAAHYPEAGLDAVQVAGAETNSPAVENELGSYQYWKDIHQQAEASGNVKLYLERKDISRSSYYDNVKKHGLSGVSKKAGQKPDTKPDTQPLQ